MNTNKKLTGITYIYSDIDAYIQQEESHEAIIERFCINTGKLYSRETTISDLEEYVVKYTMMKI